MVTLEQVEKLREYANVSYDEAKAALEMAGGDILQALIDLEHQGKVKPPEGGGQYVSYSVQSQRDSHNNGKREQSQGKEQDHSTFSQTMHKCFDWMGKITHKGNINSLVVEKHGEQVMKLPVTALLLLLLFAFWVVIPLFIIGLFFNFRYSFYGPDLGNTKVNNAMETVANAAEDIKKDIQR